MLNFPLFLPLKYDIIIVQPPKSPSVSFKLKINAQTIPLHNRNSIISFTRFSQNLISNIVWKCVLLSSTFQGKNISDHSLTQLIFVHSFKFTPSEEGEPGVAAF